MARNWVERVSDSSGSLFFLLFLFYLIMEAELTA